MIDYSDIFTGYHIIEGMLRGDPVKVAAGVGARTAKAYYKLTNEPNRMVKGMFGDVEKLIQKRDLIRYKINEGAKP